MSVKIKTTVCINGCNTFTIKDDTGVYTSPDNINGWGGLNYNPSDVDEVVITVIYPDNTTENYIRDLITFPLPATAVVPFDYYTINLNGDGKYKISVFVRNGVETSTATYEFYSYCAIKCCISNMWLKLLGMDKCEGKELYDKAILAESLYKSLVSFSITDDVKAKELQRDLEKLCNSCGCGCNNCK